MAAVGDGPAYADPLVLTARASIALARGDLDAAQRACGRAVDLAWRSDAQARAQAFSVGAAVALATGRVDEANQLASAVIDLGTVLVPALCSPAPTLADVAWLTRDLDRARDLRAILDATPIASPWVDAAPRSSTASSPAQRTSSAGWATPREPPTRASARRRSSQPAATARPPRTGESPTRSTR